MYIMIKVGEIYRHYKGNIYIVIGIGTHTETNDKMVVYSPINDRNIVWIRPYSMWSETIDKNKEIKRFELVNNG